MAGRPRRPTAILQLTGEAAKRPERMRKRANEPKPERPLGACPKRFGARQREVAAAWKFIAGCCPDGVLTEMDRPVVMQASALMAEFWAAPLEFPAAKHARLESVLSKLGMTPVDRSKVVVAKPETATANPFARFRSG